MVDRKQDEKRTGREMARAVLQMDRMVQIVLILPVSVFVGWLMGLGLDRWLHQHWISLAGIFVGFGAGVMQMMRLLREMEQKTAGKQAGPRAAAEERGAEDDRIDEEPK